MIALRKATAAVLKARLAARPDLLAGYGRSVEDPVAETAESYPVTD